MEAYRVETSLTKNRALLLQNLPFSAGERVEVIVLRHNTTNDNQPTYPLRGQPIHYENPFDSVAEGEWGVLA